MNTHKIQTGLQVAVLGAVLASGCYAQAAAGPAGAAYGTVPGKRIITPQNELRFEAEPGFPPGVFAVPLNVSKAVAFDTDGTGSGVCSRIDEKPFELAQISAIYEIPKGYMIRVTYEHDHEGFGSDDKTYLYVYDGQWRLFASAERTRLY